MELMDSIVKELGLAAEPAWLGALSPEHRATLLAAIQTERRRRATELRDAIEGALQHVPRLLRVALRRVLFP
ncbi:hypothetical protein BH11MYX1_BH11MYX1_40670 [soil metagenome]